MLRMRSFGTISSRDFGGRRKVLTKSLLATARDGNPGEIVGVWGRKVANDGKGGKQKIRLGAPGGNQTG